MAGALAVLFALNLATGGRSCRASAGQNCIDRSEIGIAVFILAVAAVYLWFAWRIRRRP